MAANLKKTRCSVTTHAAHGLISIQFGGPMQNGTPMTIHRPELKL